MNPNRLTPAMYNRYLILIAGFGGLLYGIDVGIISAALLYLGKTISLTLAQTSAIVAAVLGGSMFSSLIAGFLADWFGRKKMMIVSAILFIASVGLIVLSRGYVPLFAGRLLQGLSGGVIAVVVPLYLAECLAPKDRGKGSAIFQLMLTVGIVIAALTGLFYTRQAETAIAAAAGNPLLIRAIQDHAWRGMFLSVIYPGLIFFAGCFFLSETPRWLFRRNRPEAALAALRRSSSEDEAQLQMHEMEALAASTTTPTGATARPSGSLLQRKYVVPFVLACVVLICNQTTGINSILGYLVIILKQAGMDPRHATQGDLAVKLLNCLMTVVAVALVDRKGRKFLLILGTAGVIVALSFCAFLFHSFESRRIDVTQQVQQQVAANALTLPVAAIAATHPEATGPQALTVLYSYGSGNKLATALTPTTAPTASPTPPPATAPATAVPTTPAPDDTILQIHPDEPQPGQPTPPLTISKAFYGPVPSQTTGWLITCGLALFIASFSIGPGVVVWLALSELMPTRIRSAGMGIALLLNQAASTLIAGVFLPVVGSHGYYAMFAFWAAATLVYFLTAVFFLPETKGKSLEEIEQLFTPNSATPTSHATPKG
jgi:SP family myo-inositol transporter-like MFS transporter 13